MVYAQNPSGDIVGRLFPRTCSVYSSAGGKDSGLAHVRRLDTAPGSMTVCPRSIRRFSHLEEAMQSSAAVALMLISLAGITIRTASPQTTVYEPSATDSRVVAVLAAEKRLQAVMLAHDIKGTESLMAPDLLVNAPINKVVNRDNVLSRLGKGQISYEPDVVRNMDFVGVREDLVVTMGEEIVQPNKDAPKAGMVVHRRFTDIWKQIDGVWKLWIRQATITTTN